MKKKELKSKLKFRKETIAKLSVEDQKKVKGGGTTAISLIACPSIITATIITDTGEN